MPLRDHFRGWLRGEIAWSSFACAWCSATAVALNALLPDGFRALPSVRNGIEIYHDEPFFVSAGTTTFPFELAGEAAQVLVYGNRDGRYLAAAIELVSESIKEREAAREAFTARCMTYLQRGVGLVIVDLVTTRASNLHDALLARVSPTAPVWGERLYATAYRPSGKNGSAKLTVWQEALALGAPLPTVPLWLLHGPVMPAHLEATYEDTFRRLRLPTEEPERWPFTSCTDATTAHRARSTSVGSSTTRYSIGQRLYFGSCPRKWPSSTRRNCSAD